MVQTKHICVLDPTHASQSLESTIKPYTNIRQHLYAVQFFLLMPALSFCSPLL